MCDLNKPLFQCTLGEFAEAVAMQMREQASPSVTQQKTLPKNIKGLMQIFNCGRHAALRIYNSGLIDEAIIHIGAKTFLTNPDKAIELYSQSNRNEA